MIGTGALAPELIRVHCKVRPIEEIAIWGRTAAQAESLAARLADSLPRALGRAVGVRGVLDRAAAVGAADIVSCATLSKTPLVEGAWLRPGQHVDLVGAYTPDMRESDDQAVRAAQVFVDTRAGALKEAGDIVQALRSERHRRGRCAGRPVRVVAWPASRSRAGRRAGHHALQVGRRGAGGSGGGGAGGRAGWLVTPELRDGKAADAEAVADVFLGARRTAMPWLAVAHSEAETRRWIATILLPAGRVRVAELGGVVAGFAVVREGWLEHLYVAPAHQGMGVGSRLLDDARRIAGRDAQSLRLPAQPARPRLLPPARLRRDQLQRRRRQRGTRARPRDALDGDAVKRSTDQPAVRGHFTTCTS